MLKGLFNDETDPTIVEERHSDRYTQAHILSTLISPATSYREIMTY
jgi:hypothetical protein